jgi:glucose/arabinose dehydrogenase
MKTHSMLRAKLALLAALILAALIPAQAQTFTSEDGVPYTVELVTRANYPVALAFAPDGRLFYTEKTTGSVRVILPDGTLQREPVITFEVDALAERGLLGITLDPAYADNGLIWVFYTARGTARDYPANTIARFREADGVGSDPEILLQVPITTGSLIHNGGNLRFDGDGLLYVSVGDYDNAANSQDLTTIPGKIHRFAVTGDGLQPAPDNPFPDSSIYAYGLRNSFDFDFDPISGHVFATENGLHCDDEINVILSGFNYGGGPGYTCGGTAQGIETPLLLSGLLTFTPTQAPTGIVIYDHPAVEAWYGSLFFCVWNDGYPSLRRVVLDESRVAVTAVEPLPLGEGRCRIDLEIGPEGALYFTTVGSDGGAIYRLTAGGG